jgi:hypothetical protein
MPNIHITDWNSVNLSHFPRFNCLCELCSCGCFDRSLRPHAKTCKKSFSTEMDKYFTKGTPTENSLYRDSFKKGAVKNI